MTYDRRAVLSLPRGQIERGYARLAPRCRRSEVYSRSTGRCAVPGGTVVAASRPRASRPHRARPRRRLRARHRPIAPRATRSSRGRTRERSRDLVDVPSLDAPGGKRHRPSGRQRPRRPRRPLGTPTDPERHQLAESGRSARTEQRLFVALAGGGTTRSRARRPARRVHRPDGSGRAAARLRASCCAGRWQRSLPDRSARGRPSCRGRGAANGCANGSGSRPRRRTSRGRTS